ncbi:sensor histidine kinase [Actinomadura rupiterrae]|uniref:sensor histidine kinase n=1 Tax=Actinomadura rupiterrae TaxID=559627 RepID=UPI0020A4CCB7|nr:histidine kinase [Actinomadura rupiterrae]MCP2339097.1 signal transduction histidine kinase [Actinomadura rupiterrae]
MGGSWGRARVARLLVVACAIGYLLLMRGPGHPHALMDCTIAAASLGVLLAASRWPLAAAFVQPVLLVLAARYGSGTPVVEKVGASIAVFEVTLRRDGRSAALALTALAAGYTAMWAGEAPQDIASLAYKGTVMLALPVLLAAYLRSVENEARAARERAEEAERRRELAEEATRMAERTAIARELHDIVAHHMASIVLRVGVARHVFGEAAKDVPEPSAGTDMRVGAVLDDVHGSATTALADLRRLLAALRSDPGRDLGALMTDPGDLPAALAGMVDRAERAGLKVDASVGADLTRLDAVRALTVLRLVQEGMTNVVKHAGPGAAVRLEVAADEQGRVRVELANDLPGGASAAGAGHGLPGMRERVELAGGTLAVGPSGDGWRLAALLPGPAA